MSDTANHFYFWTANPSSVGTRRFVREAELPKHGFSSTYAVSSEDATKLGSAGLVGYQGPVRSAWLVLDIDEEAQDDVTKTEEVKERLNALGLAYSLYATGNRGYHFVIPRDGRPSRELPAMDKAWVKANIPQADPCLYTHFHWIRREGAKHEKTGRRKELVEVHEGRTLEFQEVQAALDLERHGSIPFEFEAVEYYDRSIFEDPYVSGLLVPQSNGARHKALVSLAYALVRRGAPPNATLYILEEQNKLNQEPRPQADLEKIVRYVYATK